ncbi:YdcF family protein [Streptomyces sp. P17]|uniref:YdcF family protein n=1 Tax=Streptomyces sp. P17 TaxID=3074716 RepID=UPI0028F3EA28|nr:YdcF family protein [Streptomyces sp. P17]MDT9698066.1 YdcF family protein [Streptomyces sp. P17]
MAACVLALLPMTWMYVSTGDRLRTVADAPRTDVAVVFGAGLWQGEPSPYLAHRLDAAAELYRAGKVKVVLVTGDNSRNRDADGGAVTVPPEEVPVASGEMAQGHDGENLLAVSSGEAYAVRKPCSGAWLHVARLQLRFFNSQLGVIGQVRNEMRHM